MKKKTLSKILTLGILLNSISVTSFAGVLSEDGRYETFTDNNIAVNNVLEEDKVDVKIEGDTLVNLWNRNKILGSNGNMDVSYNELKFTHNENYKYIQYKTNKPLEINQTYTAIFEIFENTMNTTTFGVCAISADGTESNGYSVKVNPNAVGIQKLSFTPTVETTNVFRILHENYDADTSNVDGVIRLSKDIILLEGDWTNKEIPEYFEGMQSSFEDQLVTEEMVNSGQEKPENLGKYKVECKVTGKNKLDLPYTEENKLYSDGGSWVNKFSFDVIKGKTYTFSLKSNFENVNGSSLMWGLMLSEIYSTNPNLQIYTTLNANTSCTFVANKTGKVYFVGSLIGGGNEFWDFQLEEGSTATPYQPYQESINTFYLNSPLLKGDTIEYINGQAYHVKRYEKVVLNGSENWFDNANSTQAVTRLNSTISGGMCHSDTLPTTLDNDFKEGALYEGRIGLGIVYNSSTLTSLDEVVTWLQENPTTVVYELAEPIYEPIKADLLVQLFEGTTHISNNSNTPAIMEVIVDRALNRAKEAIEIAKNNPTIENMALARMWINLANETIKKDEFQNEINNITKVEGLEIEKKSITSNIDLYIKPENSLTMSLSTNNIVFEDYSSVSDLDMDNAVQISVSSSLPYRLNSYLETEIQNEDGTSKIDKEFLHIKEDTNTEYKQFLGINQKLTLKEDCEAGKNNTHNIDFKLKASSHNTDVYKTVIKFEAEQK